MVDKSISPYFDDYRDEKNFHQILFTPGRAVQVRELNQLQTILQKQIERFGNHIFENGSMVIPGEINYDLNYEYITLTNVDYGDISDILNTNIVTVKSQSSDISARVIQHIGGTAEDPITFYLQYESGDEDVTRFEDGDQIRMSTDLGVDFATATVISSGQGSVLTVEPGIFYINGYFVRSEEQRAILSKYTSTPSVVVGFRLVDSVVDWTQDNSLLDNSSGTTNFNAIGADRLKLTLQMEVHGLYDEFNREDFLELAKFENGVLQKKVRGPDYNVLETVLARRTYDQAGDYTVAPFGVRVREHLDDGTNGGLYQAPEGDASKFVVGIEPGKAYVKGYEIENLSTTYVPVEKARDTAHINNSTVSLPVGNYILVRNFNRLPLSGQFQRLSFYSGTPSSPGNIPSGTLLGTARVRYSVLHEADNALAVYLFDIRNASGSTDTSFVDSAKSVYMAGTPAFTANIISEIIDSLNYSLVFRLPVDNVKSLLNAGISDTSYSIYRQYTVAADSSGTVVLTAGANEIFALPTPLNSSAYYNQTTRDISGISTIGGVPSGSTLTIEFGSGAASAQVVVNVEVIKQIGTQKSKTPAAQTVTLTPGDINGRRFSLGKADVFKIKSIKEDGVDKTDAYTLIKNITPEFYGISQIELKPGEGAPTKNIVVEFEYFVHGTGDFFSVDSYASIPYEDIPKERINGKEVSLADVVDFRPRINDAGTDFTGTGSSIVEAPAPYTLFRCDIEHYLSRIDKVFVNNKGAFGVVKGVPSIDPKEPQVPENAMALYKMSIPAYTADIKDISLLYINNRRYTMRDIGALEDRIANLEYYTTLSLVEQETEALQIIDPVTGLNRFKNGFITDSFVDHATGLFTSPDYKCSVSSEDKQLRPEFNADSVDFEFNPDLSTHVVKTGSLVTLPFTEKVFVEQMMASGLMNVNPYAVYRWNGSLELTPNSDTWYDSVYTDPEVTYQVYNNGKLTQQWNSWGLNWTGGTSTTTNYTMFLGGQARDYKTVVNGVTVHQDSSTAHDRVGRITTSVTETAIDVVNDKVVNQSVIPYMRSREVKFVGTGLMPSSRVYAFFDGVDVSAHCKQDGKDYGQPMFSDVDGEIKGTFRIPNNDNLRFRTGTKRFTLIDNPQGIRETSLSYADASYSAKGILQTRTQSIVATQQVTTTVRPWDPLAQSFFVEQAGGVFLTSIDLYFGSKDRSAPVTLEIREMVNGYPGQNVVPYSEVLLKPSQVNVSSDATVPTRFTFKSPVYLPEGNEYCFVVMSNSNDYHVYVATMGERQVNSTSYVSKQPFVGVLFKSQNNTTWTADQQSDMKFRLNCADFDTSRPGTAVFSSKATEKIKLQNNALLSTSGSGVITVRCPNHGFIEGSRCTLSGVDSAPGIALDQLNNNHIVQSVVDFDTFTISIDGSANSTGSFGGANIECERNLILNVVQPVIQELLFESTNLDWWYRGTTYKSINGTEVPYLQTNLINIAPNENNNLSTPNVLMSESNISNFGGNEPSAILLGNISSELSNISPAIDVNRMSLIGVSNRINNPATLSETQPTGGNAAARYLTNVTGLRNAANSIKVFVDVNQPQGSSVVLMYRTGNTVEEVEEKNWSILPNVSSTIAQDTNTFTEFEYEVNDIPLFSFYQFKIVMLSESSSNIPRLKRFRGIALGT